MLEIKLLSQRDPRWSRKKLGFGTGTIGQYGCALTSLTMLINFATKLDYTPDKVNELLKKVGAFTGSSKNLLAWSKVPQVFPFLKWVGSFGYDNAKAVEYIYKKKIPVIVRTDAHAIGGRGYHFVLFVGDHKAGDVWTGTLRPTSIFKPLSGLRLFDIDWQKAKEFASQGTYYKGIDLTNLDSVKAAIDVWKDVVDGKYTKTEEFNALKEKYESLLESYNSCLDEIEEMKGRWGERETSFVNMLNENSVLISELKEQLEKIAKKLNCSNKIEVILKTIEGLLNSEDRWQKAERDKTKLANQLTELNAEFNDFLQKLAKELDLTQSTNRVELKKAEIEAIMSSSRERITLKDQLKDLQAKLKHCKDTQNGKIEPKNCLEKFVEGLLCVFKKNSK